MNSKYEVIRQFVAAHGGRAELIEHERRSKIHIIRSPSIRDSSSNATPSPAVSTARISSSRCDSRTEADVQLLNHLTISPGLLFSTIMAGAGRTIDMMGGKV